MQAVPRSKRSLALLRTANYGLQLPKLIQEVPDMQGIIWNREPIKDYVHRLPYVGVHQTGLLQPRLLLKISLVQCGRQRYQ